MKKWTFGRLRLWLWFVSLLFIIRVALAISVRADQLAEGSNERWILEALLFPGYCLLAAISWYGMHHMALGLSREYRWGYEASVVFICGEERKVIVVS